jgi:mRNA-degrading endonuclease HigB of HigAB toxin-antitoxin module
MHLRFFSDTERSLKQLLNEISNKTGKTEEDILYEVTTFQKGNDVIEGKRNIFDLSERHKSVVVDKLKKNFS